MCLLEERNGDLASDDAEVGGISGLEQLVKNALLLGRKVQIRMSLCCSFANNSHPSVPPNRIQGCAGVYEGERGREAELGGPPDLRAKARRCLFCS